jgi:flavodoxin
MNAIGKLYTREALVLFDSKYGNTRRIAEAIGEALGEHYHVSVRQVAELEELPEAIDLLVVGGPTHNHGASRVMQRFLDPVPRDALLGMHTAAFDTRYKGAGWLMGSAAARIARALKKAGAELVVAPESFFIERDAPPPGEKHRLEREKLEAGEVERAREWAHRVLEAASSRQSFAGAVV